MAFEKPALGWFWSERWTLPLSSTSSKMGRKLLFVVGVVGDVEGHVPVGLGGVGAGDPGGDAGGRAVGEIELQAILLMLGLGRRGPVGC